MFVTCAKCNGTGKKENQFFTDRFLGVTAKRKVPSREKECKICRGRGKIEMVGEENGKDAM